jgi:hypothetical protein
LTEKQNMVMLMVSKPVTYLTIGGIAALAGDHYTKNKEAIDSYLLNSAEHWGNKIGEGAAYHADGIVDWITKTGYNVGNIVTAEGSKLLSKTGAYVMDDIMPQAFESGGKGLGELGGTLYDLGTNFIGFQFDAINSAPDPITKIGTAAVCLVTDALLFGYAMPKALVGTASGFRRLVGKGGIEVAQKPTKKSSPKKKGPGLLKLLSSKAHEKIDNAVDRVKSRIQ